MKEVRDLAPKAPPEALTDLERQFEPQIVPGTGRYPGYRDSYASDGFNAVDYWRAIRKRLWLVIGFAVLITTLTAIYMAQKPNIYRASGVIQVDHEQPNPELITNDRQRALPNMDPAYFNTQLQLITSDTILRRVVKENSLDTNKIFQEIKEQNESSGLRGMLRSIGLASSDKKPEPLTDPESLVGSGSAMLSGDEVAEAVRLQPYVDIIKRNLSADPVRESRATVKDTRLIEVAFLSTDRNLSSMVVNAIGASFATFNQERRTGTSRKTSDFLQTRIMELQNEIRDDERKLVELKRTEGILTTSGDATIVIDRLSGLNKQVLEAEDKRKSAESEYNALANSPERLKSMAEAESARYITERENFLVQYRNENQRKVAELRSERAKLLEEFFDTAPEIKEVDSQIVSLNNDLKELVAKNNEDIEEYRSRTGKMLIDVLRTRFLQAREYESKIKSAYNQQYDEAQGQNAGAVIIQLLEQNIQTNKGTLDSLRKQQSSNDIASQGTDNNISIAEPALPPEIAAGPRRTMTVGLALILSTMFGMGLALFLDYLDDTISSTDEVESLLQLPALAAIPTVDSMPKKRLLLVGSKGEEQDGENDATPESELLIHSDPRSSLAESYRQLRTSILLSTAGHPPKTLLVASSLPSEGKTTTATNTAISLAQTGAKVVIIDADMRRPRLHSVFNIENGNGLSTILSTDLSDAEILKIAKFEERTKLHMITSGPIPPNPAELIGSEPMKRLLDVLKENFTHVVIDSPPITSFTDAVLIASMVDGVVLVVNSGKSSKQVVKKARQLLNDVGAKILGVVLNNVNLRSQDNYYYYQSYYTRDGYGPSDEA